MPCQFRADFVGVWIGPFKGERSALLGLHGIDAAEVVLCQIGARAVRTALEDKAFPVGRDFSLAFDELGLIHSKKRRDARDLRVRDAHDSVLDAAARPAHPALEIIQFHLGVCCILLTASCMNPLWKLQVLQFTSKDIVRRDLFNVGVHVEAEENGHIPGH